MQRDDLNPNDPVFSRRFQVNGLPDGALDLQRINRLVMERVGSRFNPLAYAKLEPHNILRMYIAAWVLAANVDDGELEEALDHGNGGFVDVWSEHMFCGAVREARSRFKAPETSHDMITMVLRVISNHNFHEAYSYVLLLLTLPSDYKDYSEQLKRMSKTRKTSVKRDAIRDDSYVWRPRMKIFKEHAEQTMRRLLQCLSNDLTAAQMDLFSFQHVESSFRGYLDVETIDRVKSYIMALRDPVFSALIDSSVSQRTVRPAVSRYSVEESAGQGLLQAMTPGDSIEESDKEEMYRQVLTRLGYEDIERALDLLQGNYSEYVTENNQVSYSYEDHAKANPDMSPQELRQTFIGRDPSSDLREEGAQIRRHLLEAATDEELRILTYIKPLEQCEPEGDLLDYESLADAADREEEGLEDEIDLDNPGTESIDTLFNLADQDIEDLEGLWETSPVSSVREDRARSEEAEETETLPGEIIQELEERLGVARPEGSEEVDADEIDQEMQVAVAMLEEMENEEQMLAQDRVSVQAPDGNTLSSVAVDLGIDDSEDVSSEEE